MELGFESISARPKSKARRNSGFSSFEMVSAGEGVKDEFGGTTLSSSGGDPASSSLSSAEASQPGCKSKRARADSVSDFTFVTDELDTPEKRAQKLGELCSELEKLNTQMLGILRLKPEEKQAEKSLPDEGSKMEATEGEAKEQLKAEELEQTKEAGQESDQTKTEEGQSKAEADSVPVVTSGGAGAWLQPGT